MYKQEKIVVTGAAGSLGKMVVKELLEKGYQVVGTDRIDFPESTTDFIKADLCNAHEVAPLLKGAQAVIHMAAIPGPSRILPIGCDPTHADNQQIILEDIDPIILYENNVKSTFNIFQEAARQNMRRVVFSSSAFAVGWAHDPLAFIPRYLPIDEDHPLVPFESYGLSKQTCENIASMIARSSSVSFVSLRFTNVVHVGDPRKAPLPWPAPDKKTPRNVIMWSCTDARDVASVHVKALEADIKGHEAFMIAGPTTRYQKNTMELLKEFFTDVPVRCDLKGNDSIISTEKAKRVLGFEPRKLF